MGDIYLRQTMYNVKQWYKTRTLLEGAGGQ